MPVALGAALVAEVIGAEAAGTVLFGTLTVGQLAGSLLTTGALAGASYLLRGGGKKSTRQEQVTAKDANPRRLGAVGRVKLGGSTVFLRSIAGAYLFTGVIHCEGPIDGYEQWWLNDQLTAIPTGSTGGAVGIYPWFGAVRIESHLGEPTQEASGELGGNFGDWSSDHQLAGLAYSVQRCDLPRKPDKFFQKVFPNGVPGLRAVLRGWLCTDPRTGAVAWSNNSGVVIYEYLTRERVDGRTGRRWRYLSPTRIDQASFAAFCDLCDRGIVKADGSVEPLYRCDGTFDLSEPYRDPLRRMLATCDAELVIQPSGLVGIQGGQFEQPSVVLTDRDFISYEYQEGGDALSGFTRLKWTFTDQANDFQQIPGDPWDDLEAQAETGSIVTKSVDFSMVGSHSQGRRLAKILTHRENPRHIIRNAVMRMSALQLLGLRTVRLQLARFDIDEVFAIKRFDPTSDQPILDFASFSPDAYAWDAAAEEGSPPPVANPVSPVAVPPLAQGVTLSAVRQAIYPGVYAVQVRAAANPPTGPFAGYWQAIARIRPQAGTDAEYVDMTPDGSGSAALSGILTDGETYLVEMAYEGLGGTSDWSPAQSFVAVADPVAPDPPDAASFTAAGGAGKATLDWVDSPSGNAAATVIRRGTSTDVGSSVVIAAPNGSPNQAMTYVNGGLSPGTYRYWIQARNGSGLTSSPVGPRTVTVS